MLAGIVCTGPLSAGETWDVEAASYEKLKDRKIKCKLCPHECQVADRERGTCGVRENRNGTYRTLNYGQLCAAHVDPIEKKPLYHFKPGRRAFSIAAPGCNFICKFCQNWEISQKRPEQLKTVKTSPEALVHQVQQQRVPIMAHTYTEPVVFFEFMRDCARIGQTRNIPNVMISNGFIQKEPMKELCRYLGAVKIDLKAFTESFYRDVCGGSLKPVLETLRTVKEAGVWLEIVVLVIPTLNDDPAEIDQMSRWISRELGPDVPLHFTRYHPTFMMQNIPPTPPETLFRCWDIAKGHGLNYVYVGNMLSDKENTICPSCGQLLIERAGFMADRSGMRGNRCKGCDAVIPGVFQ